MGRQLRPLPPPGQQLRQCVRRQAQWKGREQVGQWEPMLCWQSCTLHFLFWESVWHLNLQGVSQFWCLGVSTLLGGCEVCVSVHGMVKRCMVKGEGGWYWMTCGGVVRNWIFFALACSFFFFCSFVQCCTSTVHCTLCTAPALCKVLCTAPGWCEPSGHNPICVYIFVHPCSVPCACVSLSFLGLP